MKLFEYNLVYPENRMIQKKGDLRFYVNCVECEKKGAIYFLKGQHKLANFTKQVNQNRFKKVYKIFNNYTSIFEEDNEENRTAFFKEVLKNVEAHINELEKKKMQNKQLREILIKRVRPKDEGKKETKEINVNK